MTPPEQAVIAAGPSVRGLHWSARLRPELAAPVIGLAAWAYGVSRLRQQAIGSYGLLAEANVWFVLGLVVLVAGFVLELSRSRPRTWLLIVDLVALIVAVHATIPLLYGVPEYAWVYKHIGIASAFARYGRLTDPGNIYDQWPALFAAVAAIASLGHTAVVSFATWAPLAFELADALLLLAVFRCLGADRRIAFLAVALYEGLVAWVGQDYLSPQAFAYMLWLAIALIIVRWLRSAQPVRQRQGRLTRLQTALLAGLESPPSTSGAMRVVAVMMVSALYCAIVAAHQLTPYMVLAAIGSLMPLGVVRPRWLLLLLAAIAGAYLVPRYSLISSNFGGLFSGGNPIANASGSRGTYHAGAQATTAQVVHALAAAMWLLALAAVARQRRTLGRVAIPAALAFSPFLILGAQSYGGEAIYRVYLFSAPWCALLIAGALCELRLPQRLPLRWPLVSIACGAALFAGLQGLYGPVSVDAFTPSEVAASQWLYGHIPQGSLIVLPDQNFPSLEVADYNHYELEVMPSDPQIGVPWLNESNLPEVKRWIAELGHQTAYIVLSSSMRASAGYFGAPVGYAELVRALPGEPGATLVYRNADAAIYRLDLVSTRRASATAAPTPAAAIPAKMAAARVTRPLARSRRKASGIVRRRYRRSSARSLSSPR